MRLIDADKIPEVSWDKFEEEAFRQTIAEQPTVDAEPVRHGAWLSREEGCLYPFWERYTCSECGKHADDTKYCPNCGAKMERKEK